MSTELDRRHTHEIGFWPTNRLIAQSAGRGWRDAYAALATVNSWTGTLAPKGHPCLAYCLNRPASLRRRQGLSNRWETRTVRPRHFFVIPAHEQTEWRRDGSSDMLMLYLRQDAIDALSRKHASQAVAGVDIDLKLGTVDPLLEQIALALLGTLKSPPDGGSAIYADGLVQAMVLHLLRIQGASLGRAEVPSASAGGVALKRVLNLIEVDPGATLSTAVLAEKAGLTPQTFAKSFAKTFGITVHQYVLDRRLDLAKRLLVSTDLPLVDIALRTGFSSQSHLSTAFKRLTGATPRQYRDG